MPTIVHMPKVAMPHQLLDADAYARWRETARVLEQDAHGDKVLCLADGRLLKLFRAKGLFSRSRWQPGSRRFSNNSQHLHRRGIRTITVETLYHLPQQQRHAVLYTPLPGQTLRELGQQGRLDTALAVTAGRFMARLHAQGVLFRSLHLGNILCLPDGGLGLIDIADLNTWPWPLNRWQRRRNVRHLLLHVDTPKQLSPEQAETLIQAYLNAAGLPPSRHRHLQRDLQPILAEHRRRAEAG